MGKSLIGDFTQAYVIAHEVGHHVQTLLGNSQRVTKMRERAHPLEGNKLSVRLELQADCLAGVWAHKAHRARQILEAGDIEEGLKAAGAIGDDRIQRRTRGQVVPESFTYGSSAQRVQWFRPGLERAHLRLCNAFQGDVG
ncbi:MAG: neutral zinc metallopeptidase [Deltaproteobacteria bacterium]|nr:neutral zinc metallopeptidase [Deltaproteobacteria bacterium]